jgi:hypothetical protein
MSDEHAIARYRQWYRRLLRFYSRPHRERFGESMEQTFSDLCHERTEAGERLGSFVLWMFVETSAGIMRENGRFIMQNRSIARAALVTACVLLIPLMGNLFMGWSWRWFAFPVWGGILFGTGLTYEFVAAKGGTRAYRTAVGIACVTGFILFWINAAVGIIGDGPVKLLYLGVFAVGFFGALIARFQPRGMSLALFATAVAQMLVPVIALVIWKAGGQDLLSDPNSPHPPFHPGIGPVFGLNGVFAALWVGAGLLFRRAGEPSSKTGAQKVSLA